MRQKTLYLYLVAAFIAMAIFVMSGLAVAATIPTVTPLGYNTLLGSAPARIAADNIGKLYITEANTGSVNILSNNGVLLSSIRIEKPLGIAVDSAGKIFVGSESDGSVSVLSSDGGLLYKLGVGSGEFGLPNDIAISSSGTVYVTDSMRNAMKAYSNDGAALFSISGLNFPTGIAVDDIAGEIYISDHNANMIKIFDLNGVLKRTIKGSSMFKAIFMRPQGIALDSTRFYVVDTYNSMIAVYGKDGAFLKYIGNYGEGSGEFRTPIDVVIDKDNKLFVTNHNNSRIESIGIDNYSLFKANPDSINISVFEGSDAVTQTVNLTSQGNPAEWTSSVSSSWTSVSLSSGTTPATSDIIVNPSGMSAGNYSSQVMFTSLSGTTAFVRVNLEVKPLPKVLYVTPANISLKYQKESLNYPSGNIVITSSGGSFAWTVSSSAAWISLDKMSGITPDNIKLSINSAANSLSEGNYDATVIIDGGSNVQNSPATVNVSLRVINAGTIKVTTNLKESGFEIIPIGIGTSYSGAGLEWNKDEAVPGDYTITFRHVTGYIKPYTRTFTVTTGKETVIEGQYKTKPVPTNIIAGSGGTKDKKVVVLAFDGTIEKTFEPFKEAESIRVGAGDIDGSGIDEIIVTDGKNTIKAYTAEGKELSVIQMPEWYKDTVIAVADIDHDGLSEIIMGANSQRHTEKEQRVEKIQVQRQVEKEQRSGGFFKRMVSRSKKVIVTEIQTIDRAYTVDIEKGPQRVIKLLKYADGKITEKATLLTEDKEGGFTISAGDINGDGLTELVIAEQKAVRTYSIDLTSKSNKLTQIWAIDGQYEEVPEIAVGDINGDGNAEIGLATEQEEKKGKKEETGKITILKGSGEEYKLEIEPYKDLEYEGVPTIAIADIDSDGVDEIITGAGRDEHNKGLIRTYESEGTFTNTTINTGISKFGVNVSAGRFK